MSDKSRGDPPDPLQERSLRERSPRTNLLLAATIEADALKGPVRIRNLSESGALLEGSAFPDVGENLILRRLDLEIGATVIWRTESRCGIKFEGAMSVPEWVAGRTSGTGSHSGQSRVDNIQAAIRAGLPVTGSIDRARIGQEVIKGDLDARLAEELTYVRRLLENLGDELTDEPILVQRHPKALQSFDLACQILGHLANILTAENRSAAVDAIGMEDLRARLLRKPIF